MVVFRGVTVTADAFSGNSSAAIFFNEVPTTTQGQNPEVSTVDMERLEAVSGPQPTTYGERPVGRTQVCYGQAPSVGIWRIR